MYRHYITSVKDLNNKMVIIHISDKVNIMALVEILKGCVNSQEIIKLIVKRTFYIENNYIKFVNDLDELFTLIQMGYATEILYQDNIGLYIKAEVLQ